MEDTTPILDRIDELILDVLKDRVLSTYKIAKEAKLAWSTANTHCYKLKSYNILEEIVSESNLGQKRVFWRIKNSTSKC